MENTSFSYKTDLSKANVQTNRMGSTKWTYHKERSGATAAFFRKCNFSIRISCKLLISFTNYPSVQIHTFRKCLSFICEWVLHVRNLEFATSSRKGFPDISEGILRKGTGKFVAIVCGGFKVAC